MKHYLDDIQFACPERAEEYRRQNLAESKRRFVPMRQGIRSKELNLFLTLSEIKRLMTSPNRWLSPEDIEIRERLKPHVRVLINPDTDKTEVYRDHGNKDS